MAKRATVATLREENQQLAGNLELLSERLAELELGMEDLDYIRLSMENEREFSREGLGRIIKLSRIMYLKSPLINRSVNVKAYYIWGQGMNIQAKDPVVNEVIQAFLDDPANQAEMTGHQARTLKEIDLEVTGNLFFVFFVNKATGAVRLRTIPVEEIQDIITNPEDAKEPWYYKRVWSQRNLDGGSQYRTAYYPDWRLPQDAPRPTDAEVMEYPVNHVKVGCLGDMRFGVPETYQAIDWARAYKEFLEDRATVARALSRFAWRLSSPGGAQGVAAAKTKIATTYPAGGTGGETNPPPVTGSTFIASQGVGMDPLRVSGATIHPDEGRRFLLMVAAGQGLPETFYGDTSVGTLATAKSLDRPTELMFLDRQAQWKDIEQGHIQFAIDQSIKAPGGQLSDGVDRHVDVTFPDLLERDVEARIRSIVSGATLDGKTPVGTLDDRTLVRLILSALGVDQIDELLDQIAPEDGDSLMAQLAQQKAEQAQALADQQVRTGRGDEQGTPAEEAFVEAVRELREAVRRLGHDAS
ncbi:MAG: hypothetical protein ACYC4L_04685 [Chloroflexota bacterium]